ncbi:MAG: hypothetical protein PUF50_00810, partial [Erysipelotrichaceae bacterium]|nr:hypothetical protein [Erysipelotrichaceae bacterium]
KEEKYNEVILLLKDLPDELTVEYEIRLTDIIMNPEYTSLISVFEEMIKTVEDEIAYPLFLMCSIYYRRVKDHGKQERLISTYKSRFEKRPSFLHYYILSYVDVGYHTKWRDMLDLAKKNSVSMQRCSAWHLFAELVAMTFEDEHHDASETEYDFWLSEANKAVDLAIMENPNYAKYYCTKGRILSLLDKTDEAQQYIRMAIDKEDSSKKDYTLRIGNYQYYLLKVQSHADRNQLKKEIVIHKEQLQEAIMDVKNRAESIDKSLMRNLEYLGIFSGIISFTMGAINITSSLATISFAGAAALIVVLFGVLVGVFAMFDLIIHGCKKENWKVYTLVFVVVALTIIGGFVVCFQI